MQSKAVPGLVINLVAAITFLGLAAAGAGAELGLRSEITGSGPAGRLMLRHTVWNPGTEVATNVWLTNELPAGVSFLATNQWPIGSPGPTYPEPPPPPLLLAPIAPGLTFAGSWTTTNPAAVAVAIGDLDRDGWPDLVVAHGTNAPGFTVWRSGGTGASEQPFTAAGSFGDGSVRALALGDFNGDGRPDIVCAEQGRNQLAAYFQTGDIPSQPQYAVGTSNAFSSPISDVLVADFDGDGRDDLVALEPASATVHLLQNAAGSGVAGFVEIGTLTTPAAPTALAKDKPKKRPGRESPTLSSRQRLFVSSDANGGTVSVFVHSEQTTNLAALFLPRADHACGEFPRALAVGDLDGDGLEDLVVANALLRRVTLLRGETNDTYTAAGFKDCDATGNVNALHLLDLDGDGRPEIVTGSAGQPDCIVIPNSRAADPLSPAQFGAPVHFALPAPFRNLGFDTCRDGSQAGGFIVTGHTGPAQGSLAGGQSFSVLRLTQPGAGVAIPLGDLEPGATTGVSLDLEVRVPDATNVAYARAVGGMAGLPPKQIPLPLGMVCGGIFCVSGGVTQGMGGFAVSVVLSGTGYYFSNSTVTLPDGSYCLPLPFSCGGVFPWDTTITVTTPACPGQSWVFPVSVMFAYMTLPPVYCSNCSACTQVQNTLQLHSGSGPAGLLAIGGLDAQFATGNPPFAQANPFVTGAGTGWLPDGPNSQWIGPSLAFQSLPGVYCYTNAFYLPCTNSAQLTGQWTLAGEGGSVVLNGAATAISLSGSGLEASWHPLNLTSGFVAGWNTLVFCVTNPPSSDGTAYHPTGLRTEITGRATCCAGCAEIHCPSNLVVEVCTNSPAPFGQIVNYPPPAAFSHCGAITNVVYLPPSGSFFPLGTNVVVCTATDSLGNVATCSFNVIVRPDFTPPIVPQCPPLTLAVAGCPPVMPDLTTNIIAFDNCSGPGQLTFTQTIAPGTPLTPGTIPVIVRVCDQAGNCHDCDVQVTAVPSPGCCATTPIPNLFSGRSSAGLLPGGSLDPQFLTGAPLFTTPSPMVLTNPPPAWMPNSTASQWIGPAQPYDYAPPGVFYYTNRFFLCSTNQAQLAGRWTADDFARILLNGAPTTNAILNFWSYTNWIAVNINSGFAPGWNELVFAVTNIGTSPTGLRTEITGSACCNSCVAITCPPDLSTNICANGVVVHYSAPVASSSCGAITSVQCNPPSGSIFPPGTNLVTCTAIDSQGNAAVCSFRVTVTRLASPLALTCPPDQTLFTCGSNAVAYYKATAVGQAGPVICTPPSGTSFPLGTNVVTCQAVSPCGDIATCSFKVIVKSTLLGPPSAVFTGGTPDHFVFPMEVVTPDPCVITAFQSSSYKWFDDKARDHYLAYRFTGLPANIVKAELVMRMRPTTSVGTGNDSFFFGLTNCPANGWIWTAPVTSRPESGGTWDINLNLPTNFVFDLGALNPALLARMNIDQFFDAVVQDDTTVDYMQLRVWTCPSPSINPNGLPHWTRSSGAHPPSALAVMPPPELAAFGPIGNGPALCAIPPGGNPTLRNSVEVGMGGGQAYGFTTLLDMNAPEDSEIVVSVPTEHGTNAPLFTLVKGKCPPKCNWDIKPNKKFFDDGGSACRVSAVDTNGGVLDFFLATEEQTASDSLLSLTPEAGVDQFPVSFLFDSVTGEITVTFPGTVERRLCNGLPCPRGWDGTIKGRATEGARRKGWDGVVKCPCFDTDASRIVFTPLGTNPPPPRASIEISSTGLSELVLAAEHHYLTGGEVAAAPAGAVIFQGLAAGNGVSFVPVDPLAGVNLDLGNAASFTLGIDHFETGEVPNQEQLFRISGPKFPPGTTTNRPPPPIFDVRLAQTPAGVTCALDYGAYGISNATVQVLSNGTPVKTSSVSWSALNPAFGTLDRWPIILGCHGVGVLRLAHAEPFTVLWNDGTTDVGDELILSPAVPAGVSLPPAMGQIECFASAGLQSFLFDLQTAPAVAPVFFDEFAHYPLGEASLTLQSNRLVVHNLGSSGQDGVRVDFPVPGTDVWNLDYDCPAGDGTLTVTGLGLFPGQAAAQPVVRSLVNLTSDGQTFGFDVSPQGASTYTLRVFDGPHLLYESKGNSGASLRRVNPPPGGWILLPPLDVHLGYYECDANDNCVYIEGCIEVTYPDKTALEVIGGPALTGNRALIIPENPTLRPTALAGATIHTSGQITQLVLRAESAGLRPVIECPADLVVLTCGTSAPVNFTVAASHHVGPVVCMPPSGSVFPLGETTVTCRAAGTGGQVAECSFTVSVKPSPARWDCLQVGIGIPFEPIGGASVARRPSSEFAAPILSVIPAPGVPHSGLRLVPGPAQSIRFTTVLDAAATAGAGFDLFLPPDPLHPNDPPIVSIRSKGPKGYCVKMNKGRAADPAEPMRAFAVNTNGDLLEPITFTPAELEAIGVCDIGFVPGISNCHVTIEVNLVDGSSIVEFDGPVTPVTPTVERHKGWDGCIYGPDRPVKKPKQTARLILIPPPLPPGPPITEAFLRVSGWPQMQIQEPALSARGNGGRKYSDGHVTLMKAYDDGADQGVEFRSLANGGGVSLELGASAGFDLGFRRLQTNDLPDEEYLFRLGGPKWPIALTNRPAPPPIDLRLVRTPEGIACFADFAAFEPGSVTVELWRDGLKIAEGTGPGNILALNPVMLDRWPERFGWDGVPQGLRLTNRERFTVSGFAGNELRILPEFPPGLTAPASFSTLECVASEEAEGLLYGLRRTLDCPPAALEVVRHADGIRLEWAGENYRVQGATEVSGPWFDLGAESPVTLAPNHRERFFRLICD